MSTVKTFTAGTLTINAAMPSALEQDEALSLIGSEVVQRGVNAKNASVNMGTEVLTTMFMCMPSHIKSRVAAILLSKAAMYGTNTPVAVADFQGKMMQYNTLLAELTLWNYSDFFIWLSAAANDVAPGQPETA